MEKETENRLQKIREWAIEEAGYCTRSDDEPGIKDIMDTAMIFEDYVLNGDKGKLVGALLKPEK